MSTIAEAALQRSGTRPVGPSGKCFEALIARQVRQMKALDISPKKVYRYLSLMQA